MWDHYRLSPEILKIRNEVNKSPDVGAYMWTGIENLMSVQVSGAQKLVLGSCSR